MNQPLIWLEYCRPTERWQTQGRRYNTYLQVATAVPRVPWFLHARAKQQQNQPEHPESLLYSTSQAHSLHITWKTHHEQPQAWITALWGPDHFFWGAERWVTSRCKEHITNTISQVSREFSDREKSWLFVLINIKAIDLRTVFPFSFWFIQHSRQQEACYSF